MMVADNGTAGWTSSYETFTSDVITINATVNDFPLTTTATGLDVEFYSRLFYTITGIVIIIVAFLGTVMNGFMLMTIVTSTSLRSDTNNIFLANLTVIDFIFSVFVLFPMGEWFCSFDWYHGDLECRLLLAAESSINGAANIAMGSLALVRYIYIAFPFRFHQIFTTLSVVIILAVGWILPVLIGVMGVMDVLGKNVVFDAEECYIEESRVYNIVATIILFLVPLASIIIFTGLVVIIAHRQRQRIAALNIPSMQDQTAMNNPTRDRTGFKVLRSFMVIVFAFLLLQAPSFVAMLAKVFCNCIDPLLIYEIFPVFYYVRCIVNPIVYFFFERRYRAEFLRTITCGRKHLSVSDSQNGEGHSISSQRV